jgi:DNA-binding FadR family transcriptional regulator
VEEHDAIVDAVIGGRPDDADAAMRRHLSNVAQSVRRRLIPGDIDMASRGAL